MRPAGLNWLAVCLCLGLAAGRAVGGATLWPALAVAVAALLVAAARGGTGRRRVAALGAATFALGIAWMTLRERRVAGDDLAAWPIPDGSVVRLRGEALGAPESRPQAGGSLARRHRRRPPSLFRLRVRAVLDPGGRETGVRGMVLVSVDETIEPFRAGDRVTVVGRFRRPAPPANPGEFDFARYARDEGLAGVLTVPRRDQIVVERVAEPGLLAAVARARAALRLHAERWLHSGLPARAAPARDALLEALLLGARGDAFEETGASFRRVGLAHLLAISGLHLGVLVGAVLLLCRLGGHPRPWHRALVVALVLAYLFLIDLRLPVLRAGVMTIAAALGCAGGRRWRPDRLIGLSALLLLLWRPDQLCRPGFQLSFGVVLGLIRFAPRVRRRWFGPRRTAATSSAQMAGQWLADATAVAAVAWAIATPIIVVHFGMISPLAVPLSVVALPITAVILTAGYAKIILTALLPSLAAPAGALLALAAEILLVLVRATDAIPVSVVYVPRGSPAWGAAALGWVLCWAHGLTPRWRGCWLAAGAGLTLWLVRPALPALSAPDLRVDMLAVGDGSCITLRSGGETLVFDAGAGGDPAAGRRVIVPALRALGVRRVRTLAISHADLDHFAAGTDVVDAFGVDRVLVTPQFLADAAADPSDTAAALLAALGERRVAIMEVHAGHEMRLGRARLRWLHPAPGFRPERSNDASMVIAAEAAGRRVLLTGDLDREGIAALGRSAPSLTADVLELPHHGSFSHDALRFVRAIDPSIVLQSTPPDRWRRDRWTPFLRGRTRLVTARDGECWVEVDGGGEIVKGTWRGGRD